MDENSNVTISQQNTTPVPTNKDSMSQNKQKKSKKAIIIGIILVAILIISGSIYKYTQSNNAKNNSVQSTITQSQNKGKTLVVAENIDEDGLQADTKEFQPFIDYLVSKLKNQGITNGKFLGTTSVTQMTELVREKKIDILIDSAFPVYIVSKLTGATTIADRWKGGVGTYHSAIFVKQSSPIQTLNDLKGKMLAFDSTTSTVGYFLPKAELITEGYKLTQKNSPTDTVASDEIGYTFVHGNVYTAVANGSAPAGAESELEIDDFFGNKISNYRIISRSPDISRFLVATRNDLDPSLENAIKSTLFTMDKTAQGKAVLSDFADTAKFTPITDTDTAYGEIKKLTNIVEQEIITQ